MFETYPANDPQTDEHYFEVALTVIAPTPPEATVRLAELLTTELDGDRVGMWAILPVWDRSLPMRVQEVLDDHDSIEDFSMSETDWAALGECGCAHCDDGAGICPMTVERLIGDHLRALRDRLQTEIHA